MTNPSTPTRFFGLDVRQLQRDWAIALSRIANWPILRWLAPAYITRIITADGSPADYIEKPGCIAAMSKPAKKVRFQGYLLPDKLVLWLPMALPNLKADAVRSALELQVQGVSPFLPGDMVWGHTPLRPAQGGSSTYLFIASRKIIAQHIAVLASAPAEQKNFEVWVEAPESQGLLVLEGFGEEKRRRLSTRWRRLNLLLVFLITATAFAAAITPTIKLRSRAIEAANNFVKLHTLAAPAVHLREQLVQLEQQLNALQAQTEQRLQPELILAGISKLLPDDTYLTSLQVQGSKVLLIGQTPNTAALMQQLGSQASVKNVRAPTATTRQRGAERETFNIEFTLDANSLIAKP